MPAAPSNLPPADLARYSIESLAATHGASRPWIYWLFLLGAAGGLAALPLVEVDVAVRAPGLVRPASGRRELRAPVSGFVAAWLVHDNDRVSAGQPLLVLQSGDLTERLARNRAAQRERRDAIADLTLLTAAFAEAGANAADRPPPGAAAFATAALRQESAQFLVQLETNRLGESRARSELDREVTLAAKGIASQRELDDARYQLDQTRAAGALLVQQTLTRWQTRLRDEEAERAELESTARRLEEERDHYTLRAPVAGVLLELAAFGPGHFVTAGQPLGTLSPDDRLVVEVLVPSRDAGLVHAGQAVKMQVDAFPYTQWGTLDGAVEQISADGLTDGRSSAFKLTIRPAARALRLPNGVRGELRKGFTLNARFLVARRSLFQLLYDDTSAWFDPEG
jgi:HlyD family secretion protein